MRPALACIFFVLMQPWALAQFPHTTRLEIRSGQHRPAITGMVQVPDGSLWLGSDIGLLRTDGDRVEVMVRLEEHGITAMLADSDQVFVAIDDGTILRCNALACDTLIEGSEAPDAAVNAMVTDADGRLWLATHGAGIAILDGIDPVRLRFVEGLRDEHVNDLALLPDGIIVAATDQGLAMCEGARVIRPFGEAEGAPDNLTFCVATNDQGMIWAGTDRSGAYKWDPTTGRLQVLDPEWDQGVVKTIVVQDEVVWLGTDDGTVLVEEPGRGGNYASTPEPGRTDGVQDMQVDRDGAVWWCNATENLYRADAAILFVAKHEGVDLRNASAVCSDPTGRIWFATQEGVFHHAAAFAGHQQLTKVNVVIDRRTPIVSMAAAPDGSIWAGTFGGGVIQMPAVGVASYFNSGNSILNDNVLSVAVRGEEVWFATLEGLVHYDRTNGFVRHPLPFPGFVFDLLPLNDGSILAATDGNGVLQLDPDSASWTVMNEGRGSYYSLVIDDSGKAWAAGPGTGFCKVVKEDNECRQASRSPFDGDLYALASYDRWLIAFGSTGTRAYDPGNGVTTDVTAKFGTAGIQAELNAVARDDEGSIWLATDRGLVRMRPEAWHFSDRVHTAIRSIRSGATYLDQGSKIVLPHDHERISIHFTGIHWVDPGSVRFQYRLLGADQRGQITRDREVFYSGLPPGTYTFQVRAFTGDRPGEEEWISVPFSITAPIWERAWFIILMLLLLAAILYLVIRTRDRRALERERMEQEKVRFQLEALRSQVDPHFLFNSFNTLVELIETDADRAVEHVEKLSLFFRNILLVRDKEMITVEEELRLLQNYFALEQHRFGDAISLTIAVDDNDMKLGIVPLTLQLLVENALKHNVATSKDPLYIEVRSHNGALVVSNPVRPRITSPRSTGFGLESIRKRYLALTDRPIRIEPGSEHFIVGVPLMILEHESTADRR